MQDTYPRFWDRPDIPGQLVTLTLHPLTFISHYMVYSKNCHPWTVVDNNRDEQIVVFCCNVYVAALWLISETTFLWSVVIYVKNKNGETVKQI